MKINFLLPHLKLSGGVHVVLTFAEELSKRGHDIIVAVESESPTRYIRNLFHGHSLLPSKSRVKIERVKSFAELRDADVFFADSWKVAQKLHALPVSGAKFQYIQHDERMYHGNPADVERVYRLPTRKFVNATWLHEILKKEFNQETEILFNAVDCDLFHPNKRDRENNDASIRVLLLHHDYAWKRTEEGADMVKALQKKYPHIKLILYGTRSKTITTPHDEYHYNVFGKKLAHLFADSDIYLGCSVDDSRPIAHRWAMASGVALAMYDNVSSGDYVTDGTTAMIAKKGDAEDLSQKLEALVANVDLRKKIEANALSYVRSLPTWKELTDKLEHDLNNRS
ncbi:MAG: glycosyltransferase family 4 protein [Patescibacteria group bacterium]